MNAALLALLVLAADPSVVDTGHRVEIVTDTVVVHTEWVPAMGPDPGGTFELAWPLPEATVDGARARVDDGGALRAIVVDELPARFEVRMPLQAAQELGAVPLAIPDRPGLHRVTFDPGAAFDPDVGLGFAPRLTRATTAGVELGDDRWLDARLSALPAGVGVIRYATTHDLKAAGGLTGRLESAQTRRRRLLLFAGAAFLLVVTALVAAHRRLRRAADSERADKLLAEEIDALAEVPQ